MNCQNQGLTLLVLETAKLPRSLVTSLNLLLVPFFLTVGGILLLFGRLAPIAFKHRPFLPILSFTPKWGKFDGEYY